MTVYNVRRSTVLLVEADSREEAYALAGEYMRSLGVEPYDADPEPNNNTDFRVFECEPGTEPDVIR